MKFKATIEISSLELRHIIEDYLERNGIKSVSDQDIQFIVEKREFGNQRDSWEAHEFTKVLVSNVRVGDE